MTAYGASGIVCGEAREDARFIDDGEGPADEPLVPGF